MQDHYRGKDIITWTNSTAPYFSQKRAIHAELKLCKWCNSLTCSHFLCFFFLSYSGSCHLAFLLSPYTSSLLFCTLAHLQLDEETVVDVVYKGKKAVDYQHTVWKWQLQIIVILLYKALVRLLSSSISLNSWACNCGTQILKLEEVG